MSAINRTIKKRLERDPHFREHYQQFEENYQQFKLGVLLKMEREKAGLTQSELAEKIGTQKTTISRLENHGDNVEISTLQKIAHALGKHLKIAFG